MNDASTPHCLPGPLEALNHPALGPPLPFGNTKKKPFQSTFEGDSLVSRVKTRAAMSTRLGPQPRHRSPRMPAAMTRPDTAIRSRRWPTAVVVPSCRVMTPLIIFQNPSSSAPCARLARGRQVASSRVSAHRLRAVRTTRGRPLLLAAAAPTAVDGDSFFGPALPSGTLLVVFSPGPESVHGSRRRRGQPYPNVRRLARRCGRSPDSSRLRAAKHDSRPPG